MRKTRKMVHRQTPVVKRRKSVKLLCGGAKGQSRGGTWLQNILYPKSPMNIYKNVAKGLGYFDNNSVFLLTGHSSDTGELRYKLKDNEFFASPLECGRIGYTTILPFLDFAAHNPKIKIPTVEDETSLHPLTYNSFPFRGITSRNDVFKKGRMFERWEKDSWKLYFPQSPKINTNTIPQMEFKYFSGNPVFTKEKNNFHTYEGEPVEFTFDGKTDYIEPGDYYIFDISISGVLYPNQDTQPLISKLYELVEYSVIIRDIFKLPLLSYYYLYVLIPVEDLVEQKDFIHSDISYYKYMKEVMINVTSLSYIG